MAQTIVYREEWVTKLQERLEEPKFAMEIGLVDFTNTKVMHNPYRNTSTANSNTRGTQYTVDEIVVTDQTIDINLYYDAVEFIDKADLAQSGLVSQMEMAASQADALMDVVEIEFLKEHANAGASIDDGDLATATNGGNGNPIILSATNVLEVVRIARRKIVANKGLLELKRKGSTIVWSPEQYELLVAAAQGLGFTTSDTALASGTVGVYGGFKHIESNLLDATTDAGTTHAIAMIDKSISIGILKGTYGAVTVVENPDRRSGFDVASRIDFQTKIWSQKAPLVVDINIAS